jgi:hypothetical protein
MTVQRKTPARILGICLAVVVLAVAATGLHLYRGYPRNLEDLLVRNLAPYGIDRVSLEALRLGTRNISLEGLALGGTQAAATYAVTARGLAVKYHWRDLLAGKIEQLVIDELDVRLTPATLPSRGDTEDLELAGFLPEGVLSRLPARNLLVRRWHLHYASDTQPLDISGNIQLSRQSLDLVAQLQWLELDWHAQVTADSRNRVELAVELGRDGAKAARVNARLGQITGTQWQWLASAEIEHSPALAWLGSDAWPGTSAVVPAITLDGVTQLEATVVHAATVTTAPGDEATPAYPVLGADLRATHRVPRLDWPGVGSTADLELSTAALFSGHSIKAQIQPFSWEIALADTALGLTTSSRKTMGWNTAIPLAVTLAEELELNYPLDGARSSLVLGQLSVNLGDANTRWKTNITDLRASVEGADPSIVQLDSTGEMSGRLNRKTLPRLHYTLAAAGPLTDSQVSLELTDVAQSMKLTAAGTLDATMGKSDLSMEFGALDLPFAAGTVTALLRDFDLLTEPVTISRGSLAARSHIMTSGYSLADLTQTTRLEAASISGKYSEYAFADLGVSAHWEGVEKWRTLAPVSLFVGEFDAGFAIRNMRATLRLPRATPVSSPAITIDDFSARMFGGSVQLPRPARWQPGAASNTLTLTAQDWELRELVALQQGEDIEAAGRLEGQLPLVMEDGRIIIEDGFLRAVPPGGSIRYQANQRATQVAASNEQLGMALDLLKDFQFKVLSTDVRLDKAGNLHLGLALSGRNPTQFSGRQVNFNINVDQNIDPLLQSLRLGDAVVKKLEKRGR